MMETKQSEFDTLSEKAVRALHGPEGAMPPDLGRVGPRVLLLWHFPSFSAHRSWTVFHRSGGGQEKPERTTVLEITWDRLCDVSRLLTDPREGLRLGFHAEPTLTARWAALDPDAVLRHLDIAWGIHVPVGVPRQLGLDGEVHGFELEGLRLEWWCDGPPQWAPAIQWAEQVRVFLLEALDARGSAQPH